MQSPIGFQLKNFETAYKYRLPKILNTDKICKYKYYAIIQHEFSTYLKKKQ